jgi:hypothetical protein
VSISISHRLLSALGVFHSVVEISDEKDGSLWRQLIHASEEIPKEKSQQKIFLSHSIDDEGHWIPVLHELRTLLEHEVFSCSDSILSGSNWYKKIVVSLTQCDWVLFLISKNSLVSNFCAFEIGMARALRKPILLVSIDDSQPPSYAQDIQMEMLSRYCGTKPWLTLEEGLVDCILSFASIQSNLLNEDPCFGVEPV